MTANEILNKVKEVNNIPTDSGLAKLLDCNKSRISVWRKRGFHKSTTALLSLIISGYEAQKKENK